MSKRILETHPISKNMESLLRNPTIPSIKIYASEEVEQFTEKWKELECFNLNVDEGTHPDDDLDYPWATIFASQARVVTPLFYIIIYAHEGYFLYSFESLENCVELIKGIRGKYSAAVKNMPLTYKEIV